MHYKMFMRGMGTQMMYIDDFLEKEEKVKAFEGVGLNVYPSDENRVFVPVKKDFETNEKMVGKTIRTAYGL